MGGEQAWIFTDLCSLPQTHPICRSYFTCLYLQQNAGVSLITNDRWCLTKTKMPPSTSCVSRYFVCVKLKFQRQQKVSLFFLPATSVHILWQYLNTSMFQKLKVRTWFQQTMQRGVLFWIFFSFNWRSLWLLKVHLYSTPLNKFIISHRKTLRITGL